MTLYISQQFVEQPVYPKLGSIFTVYYHLVVSLAFLLRLVSSLKPELLLEEASPRYRVFTWLEKNTSIRKIPADKCKYFCVV